jgi:hypothetical protein
MKILPFTLAAASAALLISAAYGANPAPTPVGTTVSPSGTQVPSTDANFPNGTGPSTPNSVGIANNPNANAGMSTFPGTIGTTTNNGAFSNTGNTTTNSQTGTLSGTPFGTPGAPGAPLTENGQPAGTPGTTGTSGTFGQPGAPGQPMRSPGLGAGGSTSGAGAVTSPTPSPNSAPRNTIGPAAPGQ